MKTLTIEFPGEGLSIPEPFNVACQIFGEAKRTPSIGGADWDAIRDQFQDSAAIPALRKWEKTCGLENGIAVVFWLACFICSEWEFIKKRTPSEHKTLFNEISTTSKRLRTLLAETGEFYIRGRKDGIGSRGLIGMRPLELLTREEEESLGELLRPIPANQDGHTPKRMLDSMLPSVDELLERISRAAERIEKKGPPHSQPNKGNALRGYFVREFHAVSRAMKKPPGPEVIAEVTTLALNQTTDRDLVQQLLR